MARAVAAKSPLVSNAQSATDLLPRYLEQWRILGRELGSRCEGGEEPWPAKSNPVPAGYHTVTPYISVKGAAEALEFYKRAFGAEVLVRMDMPDGRVGHAEMKIGDSHFMLADEMPEMADAVAKSPQTLGGTTFGFMIYLDGSTRASSRPSRPAPRSSARCRISSTAIEPARWRTRSATSGPSEPTSRTCRPRR